jgi:hypothetical protein
MNNSLKPTVTIQEKIRWNHFARGRMAIEWGHRINRHISTQSTHKMNAEQWGTKILQINWKYILKLWQTRNEETNGISPEQTEKSRELSLIEEFQYIQSGLQHIPFDILSLINHLVDDLKKLSVQALEAYLYGAKPVARLC